MEIGSEVTIRGVISQIHHNGQCYVQLSNGQSILTDLAICGPVETKPQNTASAASEPSAPRQVLQETGDAKAPGGLTRMKMEDLKEICAKEGLTYQPSMSRLELIDSIRAQRERKD